jgi:hypothetical protein
MIATRHFPSINSLAKTQYIIKDFGMGEQIAKRTILSHTDQRGRYVC